MTYQIRNGFGLFSLAIVIALVAPSPGEAANSYYVFDGSSLQAVIGNPSDAHVNQWAAFYFKKGASTTELSQRWGMDLQDSPEAALHSVESNQKFERTYEKWCGCAWGQDTFLNSVAPVAMVKEAAAFNPKQVEFLAHLHAGWDRVQSLIGRFNTAADLAGEQKFPRLGSGGPFSDFMSAMHTVIDQAMSIGSQVSRYSDAARAGLESQLNRFGYDTNQVANSSAQALQILGLSGTTTLSFRPGTSGQWCVDKAFQCSQVDAEYLTVTDNNLNGYIKLRMAIEKLDLPESYIVEPHANQDHFDLYLMCKAGTGPDDIHPRGCASMESFDPFQGNKSAPTGWGGVFIHFETKAEAQEFLGVLKQGGQPQGSVNPMPTASSTPSASLPAAPPSPTNLPIGLRAPFNRLNSATSSIASANSRAAADELNLALNGLLDAATRSPGPPGSNTSINCSPQCTASVANGPSREPAKINFTMNTSDLILNVSRSVGSGTSGLSGGCSRGCGVMLTGDGKVTVTVFQDARAGISGDGSNVANSAVLGPKPTNGESLQYWNSCAAGNAEGCFDLGLAYSTGTEGLEADVARAGPLYQKACDAGSANGCINLGLRYERGDWGYPKDPARAIAAYQKACDAGSGGGCSFLKRAKASPK